MLKYKLLLFCLTALLLCNRIGIGQTTKQLLVIENLRCEYQKNPIGLDEPKPRLSWVTQTKQRNWYQQSYRIIVASTLKKLNDHVGDLWDTKKIVSNSTSQIVYEGVTLKSYQQCYWKVMVWDDKNKPSTWSMPATWEMALINEKDWQASWIGMHNNTFNEADNNLLGSHWIWASQNNHTKTYYFSKSFLVNNVSLIKEAYCLFTAEKSANVFINGQPLKPIFSSDVKNLSASDEWQRLKRVDIKNDLSQGENLIAVSAISGDKLAGLVARIIITYNNNTNNIINTDSTWLVTDTLEDDWNKKKFISRQTFNAKNIAKFGNKPWRMLAYAPPHTDAAPYLRKQFSVTGTIVRARLYVAAPGFADLYLNGKKVGEGQERNPGFTRFDKRILYTTHDVTALLKTGNNALGAILGTGWYDVHDLAVWDLEKAPWRGRPRLKAQLFVEYADGSTEKIVSDKTWRVATGPILFDGIYTGEVYDSNKELNGWDLPDFDEAKWAKAFDMPNPGGKLVALSCPPTGLSKTIIPVALTDPKKNVYIVDMGENFSGHMQLRITAPKGTIVTMRYAESLEGGMIERGNIESFMAPTDPRQLFQTDKYICKGSGEEVWEQRFTYQGFRYVEVTGLPFKPTVDNFRGRFTNTLFETDGYFECSNKLLNDIQKIILQAYLSNAQNIPTDCPQREKNGWSADAHLASDLGMLNYNSASFYAKWLDDNADAQQPDGLLPVIVPSANWGLHWDPEWNSAYHIIAWNLYRFYGDKRILVRHYNRLKLYVDNLALKRKDGLIPGYTYGDWAFYNTQTSKKLTANTYLYLDADILAKIAAVLGYKADENLYRTLADEVKTSFNETFLKGNVYDNGSQAALAIPLQFGMVPIHNKSDVLKQLLYNIDTCGHIDAGILGTKSLLRTLSDNGKTEVAYNLVNTTKNPGWGYFVSEGATSLWGGWGREGKRNSGSQNHIMFGDVSAWMYEYLAGIRPDAAIPGFQHFIVQPFIGGDLTWLKASYNAISGYISINWKKVDNAINLNLNIPANTTATVVLPTGKNTIIKESGKTLGQVKDIVIIASQDDKLTFQIGSGNYSFSIKN